MEEEIAKFPEVTNIFDPIDFTLFNEEIKIDFNNLCSSITKNDKEKKAFVISRNLFQKFFSVFTMKDLKDNKFTESFYYLENCPQKIKEYQIVFIFPSKIEYINIIMKQMEKDQEEITEKQKKFSENKDKIISKTYYFFHVPKVDISVLNYTKNNFDYYETFFQNYYDFDLSNFVLDYDLISLEDKQCFKELYLFKFSDCVDTLANVLIKIQEVFGKIKYRYTLGENSKIISEILDKKEKDGLLSDKNIINNQILACFFIDRSVDYITPMCTEFTYEAMLHKLFGLSFNKMKVDNNITNIKKKDEKNKIKETQEKNKEDIITILLSHEDHLYQMIKGFNFDKLRFFLSKRLQYQEELLKSIKSNTKKKFDAETISKDVLAIKEMNLERPKLFMHINLTNHILGLTSLPRNKRRLQLEQNLLGMDKDCLENLHDYYDSEMTRKGDYYELMKLFCLENLVFGGVKGKIYDSFKNDFLLTYGQRLFFLFKNLEELKILNKDGKSKLYQILLEKLNLINFNLDVNNPTDTSFVFGGFSPISIRLIELALKKGFNGIQKDILKNLGCDYSFPPDETEVINPINDNNFILLVFNGGVTYSEIEAVRFLNKCNEFSKYKFLIVTTNIINAKSFFEEIKDDKIDEMENKVMKKKDKNDLISKIFDENEHENEIIEDKKEEDKKDESKIKNKKENKKDNKKENKDKKKKGK